MGDAGTPVTVKETYSLESFTFTEAEETIAEELKVYISGEFDVVDMKKAPYKEVFFSENPADDRWYKVTLSKKQKICLALDPKIDSRYFFYV